jgi:hypothetical protein
MPELPREIDASIHLPDVIHRLYLRYGDRGPDDYLAGKTEMRDTVMEHLLCSSLEAEEVVDLLEVEGFLEFLPEQVPAEPGRGVWRVRRAPPPS